MSPQVPESVQRYFRRNVALLFIGVFPALAAVEIASMGDLTSPLAPILWAAYLVLAVWAFWLKQHLDASSVMLVLATTGLFATVPILEAWYGVELSAFDFTASFGMVMMLGVLASAVSAGSHIAWIGVIGLGVATWAAVLSTLLGASVGATWSRALVAAAGVIFTGGLVSRLHVHLSGAISRHQEATRLQNAIATCSEALLVQTDELAIYEAVKVLSEAINADYAYVRRNIEAEGELGWEIVADARRNISISPDEWTTGFYDPDSRTHQVLSAGREIVKHARDLEVEGRRMYERHSIASEVTIPIFVAGLFRGSIGLVETSEDRSWTRREVETLWRASHMIGAYWRRQDDEEKLKASNEFKDRLLASVSHEIRTPLTAIVGLSEAIVSSRNSMDNEELDELNGIIAMQSRELAELVEDLLVASRAEAGSLSIQPDWIDLKAEVESVIRGVRESNPSNKKTEVVGDQVTAWADGLRCRQVIRNLLTNAIKYGGDEISVMIRQVDGVAQVLVVDNGSGVDPGDEDLIFERYYSGEQSLTQPGSVGIGLDISRQLAEMMGGSLCYVSGEAESRFEFTLPVRPPETVSVGPSTPEPTSRRSADLLS